MCVAYSVPNLRRFSVSSTLAVAAMKAHVVRARTPPRSDGSFKNAPDEPHRREL